MSPDVSASIKARLLNEARRRDEEYQIFLVRYLHERYLYRLGACDVRARCILKGAGLLSVWMPDPYRATRDLDLLASGASDEAAIRGLMTTVCSVPCPEDGVVFDLDTLVIEPIREDQRYLGRRAVVRAHLGRTRLRLQVDFGFGDALAVPPEEVRVPTLVEGLPGPEVLAYPRVGTVAEKFEAMVQLGRRNSRMKDFHDVWALSTQFEFDGGKLRRAVAACFDRRGTPWTEAVPDALTPAFYDDADVRTRWRAYVGRAQFRTSPPADLGDVGDRIRDFLDPVRRSIVNGDAFDRSWIAGGPWR